MKKYIYSIVAATALFASCSQDAELNEIGNTDPNAITTIGASTELSSRAVVSSTDNTKVNWETGDQLGVFGINGSSEAKKLAYTLDGDAGSTTGTFKNVDSDITAISAIMYPYQASASWDGTNSKLTCEIPSVQTATKGSFDKAAAIMYSIGNTTDVKLNYAVNFLKVTISESETNVHAISISSTNALSGTMEITTSGVTAASTGSLNSVALTAGNGQVLEAGDYYIAVKAGEIVAPTISYVYLDQTNHTATEKTKAGSSDLTFADGNVKPIKVNFSNGTVTTRYAVQLWENGPYFAEYNVGATSATDYGGYYNWGGSQNKGNDINTGSSDLSGENDTATKLWGSKWRMPTSTELEALINSTNCTVEWINGSTNKYNDTDVTGLLCTGKGDYAPNSVFLPAAGYCYFGDVNVQGYYGDYWSSTPNGSNNAYSLYFDSDNQYVSNDYRFYGYPVRAVLAE